jgi:pyridoxine kinase
VVGRVVLQAAARVRAADPRVLFCCDPLMGDCDVPDDLAAFFAGKAAGAADILVPNHFELEMLAGRPLPTETEVVAAANGLAPAAAGRSSSPRWRPPTRTPAPSPTWWSPVRAPGPSQPPG